MDFIISNIATKPKFHALCKLCGKSTPIESTDPEIIFGPFVCKACTDNNYIIRPEGCDDESPF